MNKMLYLCILISCLIAYYMGMDIKWIIVTIIGAFIMPLILGIFYQILYNKIIKNNKYYQLIKER